LDRVDLGRDRTHRGDHVGQLVEHRRRLRRGRPGADQGHREVAAQSGHGRVGEGGADPGQRLGHVGDDAGPGGTDHGDGQLMHPPTVSPAMTLADDAITWYDSNLRDLPWRQPGTSPWGVLVSEVMLQQTPVVRVEPAWDAWMTRWPTPAALAA